MKALRSLLIASLLATATTAAAQEASPWKFEFHGFVSTTAYLQDNLTGTSPGQQLGFAAANRQATDKALIGADVRSTRFSFSMSGPEVLGGAKPKAYIEFDLFGGNAAGNFGEQSALPRLRLAYTELNWGSTIVQVGQQNHLMITSQLPMMLAHTAFPQCLPAGCIGWRGPGVTAIHKLPMDGFNVELAGQAARSNWLLPASPLSDGGLSGSPLFQGRVRLDGKASGISWMGYVVGHFASIDTTGSGFNSNGNGGTAAYQADLPNNRVAKLQSIAGQIGGKLVFSPVTFAFNAYSGKNLANLVGDLFNQFQASGTAGGATAGTTGQIRAKGMWLNLGFDLTKNWSAWLFYGNTRLNAEEVFRNAGGAGNRVANEVDGLQLRYQEGALAHGLEFYNYKTSYATAYPGFVASSDGHHTINAVAYARTLLYSVNYYF